MWRKEKRICGGKKGVMDPGEGTASARDAYFISVE